MNARSMKNGLAIGLIFMQLKNLGHFQTYELNMCIRTHGQGVSVARAVSAGQWTDL